MANHQRQSWRLDGVSSRRLFDVVLTLLSLNVVYLLLVDDYSISIFGQTLSGPSRSLSIAVLALWGGLGWVARIQLSRKEVVDWLGAHAPEVCLGVLAAIGLALRVWGIGFGDPLVVHPDERQVSGEVILMLKNGTLAPREPYVYPTVFKYLLMPAFGLYYVWGLSAGMWDGFAEVQRDTFGFYLVARMHSAVLGTLTIILTYLLARRLWPGERGRWVGVVAAFFLTFSFVHIRQSHFGVTDVPMTFFIMLAVLAMVSMYRQGRPRDYVLSGCLVGIACATKYNALPVLFVLFAAHFLGRPIREWFSPKLLAGLGAVPAGFFLGYPYALLNWRPFLDHLGKWGERSGAVAFDPTNRLTNLVLYSMESGFGPVFFVLLGVAIVYFLHRRRAEEVLVATLVVATFMVLTHSSARLFPRYLLPMIPAAHILVSRLLFEAFDMVRQYAPSRLQPRWVVPAGVAVLAGVMVWPQATESVAFTSNLSRPDTRAAARQYLVEQFPPGSRIASEVRFFRMPRGYRLLPWGPLHREELDAYARERVDALVFSSDRDRAEGRSPKAIEARERLRSQYLKVREFSPDDGFRPGPTISVYVNPREP